MGKIKASGPPKLRMEQKIWRTDLSPTFRRRLYNEDKFDELNCDSNASKAHSNAVFHGKLNGEVKAGT